MIVLFLLLVIVAILLGILGAVVKGLLYLLIIGIVVFLGALTLATNGPAPIRHFPDPSRGLSGPPWLSLWLVTLSAGGQR